MAFADEVMELTTGTENRYQQVATEEEDDQVVGLERKTSSFAHAKRPDSADSSTITTTNTSSSSSFSGDGERVTIETLEVHELAEKENGFHGEHDDVNNGNVYLDVDQGSESSDAESDDHESQTVDHLNGEKKVTAFEKGSSSEDNKGSREIDEVQDSDIPEEVEVTEEEEVDIEDVKDYKEKELLENQKTPDLLCPKCKTCITKVIVLKKRVVLKKKVVPKKKNPNIPRETDHILRSEDNPPSPSDGNIAIPEPDQSFFYKCLSCFSIFEHSGVKGVNPQPKPPQEAPSDFNCLRGLSISIFKGKEPAIQKVANSHDPSREFNYGPTVHGNQFLVPQAEDEPTDQEIDNDDAGTADRRNSPDKRRLSPIPPSPHVSNPVTSGHHDLRLDISSPSLSPLEEATPVDPLLPPAVDVRPVVEGRKPEILKSIVYGGLTEALTSLGVISSAAGSGASTLNILVLGLANLFGGLILIIHNLQELREEEPIIKTEDNGEEETRYKRLLGRRENFMLHATIAILSFIITGLLPPVVYYFSFRESHNKDYKVGSVFGASLICISFLALAKAHVRSPRGSYLKSVLYYATNAVSVSGITYVVGNVVNQLLEKYGWSDGSKTPAGEMMLSLMGRKAGGFGYSSSY